MILERRRCIEEMKGLPFICTVNIEFDDFILRIPFYGNSRLSVDWGDGSKENINGYITSPSHTYVLSGEYIITISGKVENMATSYYDPVSENYIALYNDWMENLISIEQWGDLGLTNLEAACMACRNLVSIPDEPLDFPKVVSTTDMFDFCPSLENIPNLLLSRLYKVETMDNMFTQCWTLIPPVDLVTNCPSLVLRNVNSMFSSCLAMINAPSFRNTTIESADNLFSGCENLTTIPEYCFAGCSNLTSVQMMLNSCYNVKSIPGNMLNGTTNLIDFTYAFYGIGITTIPVELLSTNTGATVFYNTFGFCQSLTTIPAGLFDNNIEVEDFSTTFSYCTSLTSIPVDLFKFNIALTSFSETFSYCTSLTSIPVDLFKFNIALTSLNNTFYNCTSLTIIPSGLFDYNTEVTSFSSTFYRCTELTTIPTKDAFKDCDGNIYQLKDVKYFVSNIGAQWTANCAALEYIYTYANPSDYDLVLNDDTRLNVVAYCITCNPVGLFYNNTAVTNFQNTFTSCTGLTAIPENLFSTNTAVTSFMSTFYGCTGLTAIPVGLFDNNPLVENFSYTFYGCTSLTGYTPTTPTDTVPLELWDRAGQEGYPDSITGTRCFYNCAGLTNYLDIPANWK